MQQLVIIFICLTLSFILTQIFKKYKLPVVIGQILVGLILGFPFLKPLIIAGNETIIEFLSQLGIIFLLLLTGMEVEMRELSKYRKEVISTTFFTSLIPFTLGFVFVEIFGRFLNMAGYNLHIVAFTLGICLSITAEGTTVKL
ncbi:MAG: cation:proton antiporter, partial [Nanoarchaeota archaeon]|nr:cation:proton antiporter [Nanoarchaeota archaeon]